MYNSFFKQTSSAGYYRWLVATRYLDMPTRLAGAVLDVGAQNGSFLEHIQADFKVGLDLREYPARTQPWVLADAVHLPFVEQSFDHIIAFDILEHIRSDIQVLHEIARILKPGGMVWLSTPSLDFYLFPGGLIQRRFERAWGHIRRGYTKAELQTKLPGCFSGEIISWNEPAFRSLYAFSKIIHAVNSDLSQRLSEWVFAFDSCFVHGGQGHWLAKLTKTRQVF